jgi:mono/diheme cytochrome c family protein
MDKSMNKAFAKTTMTSLFLGALSFTLSCGTKGSTTLKETAAPAKIEQAPPDGEPTSESSAATVSTYYGNAKVLLDKYCVSCHGATPVNDAPAGFTLGGYEDIGSVKGAFSKINEIKTRIKSGSMPPESAGLALTEEDKDVLLGWIDAGALKGIAPAEVKSIRPVLNFVNPSDTGAVAGDSFEIQIALTGAPSTAKWALYYSEVNGAISAGAVIADNIPASQTVIVWDTSAITPNTYYLYAVVSDKSEASKFPAKGAVAVTRAPKVTLTSHQGNQIFKNSTGASTISWTMANINGLTIHYQLEYSSNGGATYQPIPGAEDLLDTLSFSGWNIADTTAYPQGTGYKVRVSAIDKSGANPKILSLSASPTPFGIADQAFTYYGNVYPIFLARGCTACHGNGQVNVDKFAADEGEFPLIGAFQLQNRLGSDVVLGTNGTMRIKAPNFTTADFDVVKLWKWDSAAVGVFDGLKLTSHKGNVTFLTSASPSVITWEFGASPPTNGAIRYTITASRDGNDVPLLAAASLVPKSYSWDLSSLPIDHRYEVTVTAVVTDVNLAVVSTKIAKSTIKFAITDHVYTYFGDVLPKLVTLGCGGCHIAGNASGGYNINLPTATNLANLATRTRPGTGNMPAAGGLAELDWMSIRIWDSQGRREN